MASTRKLDGYVYRKNGNAVVGVTVNVYRVDTGALVGTATSQAASAGPPPKGPGYWEITGLDDTLEYREEIVYSPDETLVRSRFSAEMGNLDVLDAAYLPTNTYQAGTLLAAIYAPIASPTFTGTLTASIATIANLTVSTSASVAVATLSGNTTMTGNLQMTGASAIAEIGSTGAVNTPGIDFHSSGNANDYDVRLIASGGGAAVGQGTLSIAAASVAVQGNLSVSGRITASAQPGARAYAGLNKAVPAATNTVVDFNTEVYDPNNEWDGKDEYVAPVDGRYLIIGNVSYQAVAGAARYLTAITVGGAEVWRGIDFVADVSSTGIITLPFAAILSLTAGQRVGASAYCSGASTILASSNQVNFVAQLLP